MEYETIKDLLVISRIGGMLEGMSTMAGAQISSAAAIRLEEAAERLEAYVSDMCKEEVTRMKDGRRRSASEKSVSKERPINRRPGRCIIVCTADGRIVYEREPFISNSKRR